MTSTAGSGPRNRMGRSTSAGEEIVATSTRTTSNLIGRFEWSGGERGRRIQRFEAAGESVVEQRAGAAFAQARDDGGPGHAELDQDQPGHERGAVEPHPA